MTTIPAITVKYTTQFHITISDITIKCTTIPVITTKCTTSR